jgi:enoyl-CoA hydratase/carnithine racemase
MTREQQAVEGLRCPTTCGVDFSETNGVATIRLNRPNVLNAVDLETARALLSAVVAAERSQTARCLLLTGAGKQTWALGRAKRLLRSAETTPLETQLTQERSAFVECVATADFAEGLKAFIDRHPPVFVGA